MALIAHGWRCSLSLLLLRHNKPSTVLSTQHVGTAAKCSGMPCRPHAKLTVDAIIVCWVWNQIIETTDSDKT